MTRQIAKLVAVLLAALGLPLISGAVLNGASAHTPNITASCSGVRIQATNYQSNQTNRWSVTINGTTQSGTFSTSFDRTFAVPQGGATSTWSAFIDVVQSNQYDQYKNGSVGPCGTAKDATADVTTTPPTCFANGSASVTNLNHATLQGTLNTSPGTHTATFVANSGHSFSNGSNTRTVTYTVQSKLTGDQCDVKDADASVTVTPASCTGNGSASYTVTNAVLTGSFSTTPGTHTATFTSNAGHAFANGSHTKTITYTVASQITGDVCASKDASASVKVTDNSCTAGGSASYTAEHATLNGGTLDQTLGTHTATFTADAGHLFPDGSRTKTVTYTLVGIGVGLICKPCDACDMWVMPTKAPKVTLCTGILHDVTLNNVVVQRGRSCTLVNVYVNGSVKAKAGAHDLVMGNVAVRKNVTANGLTGDFVFGATGSACRYDPLVGGSIIVKNSHNVLICKAQVCYDIVVENNDGQITVRDSRARKVTVKHNDRFDPDSSNLGHAGASIIRLIDVTAHKFSLRPNDRKVQRRNLHHI